MPCVTLTCVLTQALTMHLLQRGMDPNNQHDLTIPPLPLTAAVQAGNWATFKLLTDAGLDAARGKSQHLCPVCLVSRLKLHSTPRTRNP